MGQYVPFVDMRAVFEKRGSAMYFSHLDLTRTVARALRRSHQDIWMTEGFTPRPHIVFTPPLSLGYESTCEILDFRLNEGASFDKAAFISAFPPAVRVKDVYVPERRLRDIAYARYLIKLRCSCSCEDIAALFSGPVELVKKTKRSEQTVDITKFIKTLDTRTENGIIMIDAVLACGTESLSPSYITAALANSGADVCLLGVCRTAFYDINMKEFR